MHTRSVYTKSKGQKNQRPRRKFPQAPSGQVTKCLPVGAEQTANVVEVVVQRKAAETPLLDAAEPEQAPDAVLCRNADADPGFPSFSRQSRVFGRIELVLDFLRHLTPAHEKALLLGPSFELATINQALAALQKRCQRHLANVDFHVILLASSACCGEYCSFCLQSLHNCMQGLPKRKNQDKGAREEQTYKKALIHYFCLDFTYILYQFLGIWSINGKLLMFMRFSS